MTLRIEDLNRSLYSSIAEHRQDMAQCGPNDEAVRQAIEDKLTRSWSRLNGTQGTQAAPIGTRSVSVQIHSDGSMSAGTPADVAQARLDAKAKAETAAHKASTFTGSGFQNLRIGK
jgi:hypothetical protein